MKKRGIWGSWRRLAGALALAGLVAGCGADAGDVDQRTHAASPEHDRVLGFETPLADWTTSNGSPRSASTTVSQGAASLSVNPNGYTEVRSIPVAAPGAARSTATVDLRLPQALGWGDVRLVVRVPSQGHWWRDLGGQPLTGRAPGVFHTFSFSVPADLRSALNSSATDVDYRIILNVPAGSGAYLLDNLVISDAVPSGSGTTAPTSQVEFSLAVPRGLAVADVMISGTNRVTIDDRSDLSKAGTLTHVTNLGTSPMEFGAQIDAYANVTSVGNVNFLRSQSHTYGSVTTAGTVTRQDSSVRIDGAITEHASVVPVETRWTVDWPVGVTNDISRSPDSPNLAIAPGAYDSIQISSRATVTFRSGAYFINSLVAEPQAKLRIDASGGPVLFYVRDTLRLNVGLEYVGGERGQVLFAYLGNQSAYFEEAIVASVVAPNSVIDLRRPASGKPHEGSFFGKHVHVLSDATVLHLPLDWAFICPSGDSDKDGTFDCWDGCPGNAARSQVGSCGCLASDAEEADSDSDGVANCMDPCVGPGNYNGQCGCPGAGAAPAGTLCNDGVAQGVFTCDGNGTCGNPDDVAPEACCEYRTLGQRAYWVCNGCGGSGTTADHDTAAARCGAVPNRALVRIDDRKENAFLVGLARHYGIERLRIGGLDEEGDGAWSWANTAGAEGVQFWAGGADGRPYRGMYEVWGGSEPRDDAGQCSVLGQSGTWASDDCATPRAYVCESTLGAARDPGGEVPREPEAPVQIAPDSPDCIEPPSSDQARDEAAAEADACRDVCDAQDDSDEGDAACRAACEDSAYTIPPPVGQTCDDDLAAARRAPLVFHPGECSLEEPSCLHLFNPFNPFATIYSCVPGVECLDINSSGNPKECGADSQCSNGRCVFEEGPRSGVGYCSHTGYDHVCDQKDGSGNCYGYCFQTLGCGRYATDTDGTPAASVPDTCHTIEYCSDVYEEEFENDDLGEPSEFDSESLDDSIEDTPPAYPDDFVSQSTCGAACLSCGNSAAGCARNQRHPWCNYGVTSTAPDESGTTDQRDGVRGKDSTALKVSFDPEATLNFDVKPLPLGVSTFEATAAAAASSDVWFNFLGIDGHVQLFELRAELSASLCRVHSTNSRAELLGIDFLPRLAEDSGALFDTDDAAESTGFSSEDCEAAIDAYIEAVDRSKKALRDAQELVTQYKAALEDPAGARTFNTTNFCQSVLGDGPRPTGMPGSCATDQTPADTINAFVDYYHYQLGQIDFFKNALANAAVGGAQSLAALLPLPEGVNPAANDFSYFVPFGDALSDSEETTIVSIQFFIGPIPCLLEVGALADYGITGGFGIEVDPSSLLSPDGGPLASVGAQVTPHLSSGVSVFAGAGFNLGVFELKIGIRADLTLVTVDLPATARAGIKVHAEEDPRTELPASLTGLAKEVGDQFQVGYPLDGKLRRYDFAFAYDYGVDLVLSNILAGEVKGQVKVSFFFFSIDYQQRLLAFQGLDPIELNLIGGGSFDTATQKHEQTVVSEQQQPWKASYEDVPFLRLAKVAPPPTGTPASASVDKARVGDFLYGSQCECSAFDEPCERTQDCCTEGAGSDTKRICFADPATPEPGKVCSACRVPVFTDIGYLQDHQNLLPQEYESCEVDADCCDPGTVCSAAAVPLSCQYSPGNLQIWACGMTTPPHKICQRPTPYVPPVVVR